jgi:hypothetical protein
MASRDATVTLGQVLAVLEAAQEAGRDVGDAIRILRELITDNPRSAWCQCGHVEEAHSRHWRGKDCAVPVRQVLAGLVKAATRRRRDAREARQQAAVPAAFSAMHDARFGDIVALRGGQLARVGVGLAYLGPRSTCSRVRVRP